MHEAGLMQTALEMACEEARRAGAVAVRRIVLRVGTDSGVVPDALRFAFDALSADTPAAGATLDVDEVTGDALELARIEVTVP
jgi:hydrogenase nickel incorporation protein HypA/HybF